MRCNAGAKLHREHLRAEADAEERPLLAQRNFDPVDLAADIVVGIIGAHWTAEEDRAGMPIERIGQGIAKARPADVEAIAEPAQDVSHPTGGRGLLMQDNQNRRRDFAMSGDRS